MSARSSETVSAPPLPDAEGSEVIVDIHKPKAVHSWRELASEVGVIIIGVLIALSAEQVVEWLHWQHEVRESREALRAELAYDLGARKVRADQYGCIARRIEDLQRWHDSYKGGKPLALAVPIGRPVSSVTSFDAWNVAQTGQVAAHMPLEERMRYETLYGNMRTFSDFMARDDETWFDLQDFNGASDLDRHDLMKLQGSISRLRTHNESFNGNWSGIVRRATQAKVEMVTRAPGVGSAKNPLCVSLFAPPRHG